ncbi:hypothetical protein NQ318_017018 [Aromia moschata]|uniref:Uncharacterized protein n=1 Tax=Aromia moschata TaxID=1265417 RepID=A0AAV8XW59_9CUCU|nr:hypothetical protein NQ318_017018 [Aromia moschata]
MSWYSRTTTAVSYSLRNIVKTDFYFAEHFQQIKDVILQFNPAETAAIKECLTKFQDVSLETALKPIHSNCKGVLCSLTVGGPVHILGMGSGVGIQGRDICA